MRLYGTRARSKKPGRTAYSWHGTVLALLSFAVLFEGLGATAISGRPKTLDLFRTSRTQWLELSATDAQVPVPFDAPKSGSFADVGPVSSSSHALVVTVPDRSLMPLRCGEGGPRAEHRRRIDRPPQITV